MELLGLLIPLSEVLLSLLPVHLDEVWVEVSRVRCQRLISPNLVVFIIDCANEPLGALLCVHLKLLRKWSLHRRLQPLDLLAIVSLVVQDLPLLHVSFVHLKLLCIDAFFT